MISNKDFRGKGRVEGDEWRPEIPLNHCRWGGKVTGMWGISQPISVLLKKSMSKAILLAEKKMLWIVKFYIFIFSTENHFKWRGKK